MSQIQFYAPSGAGGTAVLTVTGNTGGAVSPDALGNLDILGAANVSVTGNPGTHTLTITVSGSFKWNVVAASQGVLSNNGYITNSGALITLTLPAVAAVGDEFGFTGFGTGGWLIAQNAGQTIHSGIRDTTTGAGGSLASTQQHDSCLLLCVVANTDFILLSQQGNLLVT